MGDSDHRAVAERYLQDAADGFEFIDDNAATANHYAVLAIGHALVRIADALDRIGDDLDEIRRRRG